MVANYKEWTIIIHLILNGVNRHPCAFDNVYLALVEKQALMSHLIIS